ncbi:hypothetical protein BTO30_11995 [Domibacillus antri]|uniref:ATPase BadF/BadG/BcrA/BcrD type domain-containing protein n=1 Tax=Domibacillus antri TaxID=1714264 RepID=A0A1Q8Q3P4_9BACI|nr:BadF/BadG/BcrA/BcrD ATPase family protein [Domibacillus antri]OLN21922.1 hypothetical protein BTO30_11995 [Domibacillus antri]
MSYVIGIDGGGTKTKAILADETGCVYALSVTGPSNLSAGSCEHIKNTLRVLLMDLYRQAPDKYDEVSYGFAGMSGAGEDKSWSFLNDIFNELTQGKYTMRVHNDAVNALYAGTLGNPGMLQIAGTGTITYGVNTKGQFERVGGWGYLFDDKGSGYHISAQALSAVMQAHDGRGEPTMLTKLFLSHFAIQQVTQLIPAIYRSENPKVVIAGLAPLIVQAANENDNAAMRILEEAACHITDAMVALQKKLFCNLKEQTVILSGGLLTHSLYLQEKIKEQSTKLGYSFDYQFPIIDPAGGSVIMALHDLHETVHPDFVTNFQSTSAIFEQGGRHG